MYTSKNKIFSIVSLLAITTMVLALPKLLTMAVFITAIIGSVGYYILSQYEIDYKYCLSFISQLLGLIFFVSSFLLVFTMGANLIVQ